MIRIWLFFLVFLPLSQAQAQQTNVTWTSQPGTATEIAVGADGSAWILGTQNVHGGNYFIYRWSGKNWKQIPGWATRIAVEPKGNAWIINNLHEIWRWDGRKWIRMPGLANDIDVGANGAVWIIGTNKAVYRWTGKIWQHSTSGKPARIGVGPKGTPWVINTDGTIWTLNKSSWRKIPGTAREISVGTDGQPWVVGTDKVGKNYGVWRRVGNKWKKHNGALVRMATGPDNRLWGIKADKTIITGRIAKGAQRPAEPPGIVQTTRPLSQKTKDKLKADFSRGYPDIVKSIDFARGHMQGPDIVVNQMLDGQKVSIIIYTPKGKKYRNVAITAAKADLGSILKSFGMPDFFPLGLRNATFIFVPALNGQLGITTSRLPSALAEQIGKVASKIDLKVGLNVFSKIDSKANKTGTKLLSRIGLPSLRDVTVEASLGLGNVITLKKKAPWKNPFGLKNMTVNGFVLQASRASEPDPGAIRKNGKSGKVLPKYVRLSGWGNTRIKGKTYFLFAQHVSVDGAPVGVGYGFNAKSITLQNAAEIASTMPSLNTPALRGATKAPLDQVIIENPRYRKTMPTAYAPPRFKDMMIVAATPNVTLPDRKPLPGLLGESASGTLGPLLYTSGRAKIFGAPVGNVDGRISIHGVRMSAAIGMKKIGPISFKGDLAFNLGPVKSSKTYEHEMTLAGKANLHGFSNIGLVLKAGRDKLSYTVHGSCSKFPADIRGSSPALAFSRIDAFSVRVDPKDCFKKSFEFSVDLNLFPVGKIRRKAQASLSIGASPKDVNYKADFAINKLSFSSGDVQGLPPQNANQLKGLLQSSINDKTPADWYRNANFLASSFNPAAFAKKLRLAGKHIDSVWKALTYVPGHDAGKLANWLVGGGFHPTSVKDALWVLGGVHNGALIARYLKNSGVHIDSVWSALTGLPGGHDPANFAKWLVGGGFHHTSVKDALWVHGKVHNGVLMARYLKNSRVHIDNVWDALTGLPGGHNPANFAVWLRGAGFNATSVKDALWVKGNVTNAKSIMKMLKGAGYPKREITRVVKTIPGAGNVEKMFCKSFGC